MGCVTSSNKIAASEAILAKAGLSPGNIHSLQYPVSVLSENRTDSIFLSPPPSTFESVNKLILVGVGGVGKSTIFKQIKTIHTAGFSVEEKLVAHVAIINQMVRVLITVVDQGVTSETIPVTPELQDLYDKLQGVPEISDVKDESKLKQIKAVIIPLWTNAEVRLCLVYYTPYMLYLHVYY